MTKYVAYYRVSTQRQGASGLGLEAQQRAVQAFANGSVIASYTEIESGRRDDRPVLAEALAFAKANNATLLIAKIDRLARDVHFISGLLKAGVPIVCVDMPEANIMVLQMMAVMAEQEARMISDRTKAALQSAKERGVRLGVNNPNVMAGVIAKGKASANSLFQIIQTIPDYQSLSNRALAKTLNDKGFKTINGNDWTHIQVKRVIERSQSATQAQG